MKRKILKLNQGILKEQEEEIIPSNKDKQESLRTIRLITTMSGIGFQIAFPLVISIFLGKFLDEKYSSYPKLTLMLLGVGFFVSISALVRIVLLLYKEK